VIESEAVVGCSLEKLLLLREGLPIALREGFDFRFRRQIEDGGLLQCDGPQIRLFLAKPVKQD